MSESSQKDNSNEEIVSSIHRYSYEVFDLAKLMVAGSDPEPLKVEARKLQSVLPEFAALRGKVDEAYRPDLNLILSETSLDLEYVLAGGNIPSSMRLAHVIREQSASGPK